VTDDRDLIRRHLSGDTEAFHELMARHEDHVFAVCLRIMGDRESALDATQETFLTLYRKANRFEGRAAFSTWLYRVTVNTCYDQLRRRKRHEGQNIEAVAPRADPSQEAALGAVELRPDIESALLRLPDEFRTVVVLIDLHDLPLEAVAEILGVPVGTVKSRAFRGRRMLAQMLGNLQGPRVHPIGDDDA